MINTIDLFSGCGGMSLGFQNAGAKISAAFEFWDTAAECYEENFKHPVFRIDLSKTEDVVKIIRPLKPSLIIGGPPCQDFSHAGKRIEATRANLTESYAKIIDCIRPDYFVMENVDRTRNSNAYLSARNIFKKAGYGLTEVVLDASKCGVPQKRKRFFCLGILQGNDNELIQQIEKKLSDKPMTIRDYFKDTLNIDYYYRHPRNYNRRGIFSINEPAPTIRGVNRPVPRGYPGHPNDAGPLDEKLRPLTTLERAQVQTFPRTFKWTGSKTDMEQMIGNAVPVKLAEFIASTLFEYVASKNNKSKKDDNMNEFLEWLKNEKKLTLRSARDVVSRFKRANSIVQMPNIIDKNYLYILEQQDDFSQISNSVKSQIKRSINLYIEYTATSK